MTFLPAQYDQRLGYSAQQDRLLIQAILGIGVVRSTDLVVSAASGFYSSMAAGQGAVPNTQQANGGSYLITNVSAEQRLHATPDPTNSRLDVCWCKVFDSVDGGDASDLVDFIIVEGTPQSGNPDAATLSVSRAGVGPAPTNALWLFDTYVPNAAPNSAAFTYYDRRVFASAYANVRASGASGVPFNGTGIDDIATIGSGASLYTYAIPAAINYPNACVDAWVGGYRIFSDSGRTTEISTSNLSVTAAPSGTTVDLTVTNFFGADVYPTITVKAVGY